MVWGEWVKNEGDAYMVTSYNETTSGNYYTLEAQKHEPGIFISKDLPPLVVEINEGEQKYPYLLDTYRI